MGLTDTIKTSIKYLRSSQPFNRLATSGVRQILSLTGLKTDFFAKHLHRVDLVESILPNGKILKLNSKGDDWVSNHVFWHGWNGYEPETIPLFFRMAEKSDISFDVGAYVGFFTLLAAHANPDARVFAFEPMPKIFERLNKHVHLNNLTTVKTIFGAVGSEEGEADFFHLDGYDLPTSSSLSYEFMKTSGEIISTKVRIFQLDKFAEENGIDHIDLMKIDTETTEPDVLLGAMNLLQKSKPNIFCEVLYGRAEGDRLKEILEPLGYKLYLLTPNGPVEKHKIEGDPLFLNYLFTTLDSGELSRYRD